MKEMYTVEDQMTEDEQKVSPETGRQTDKSNKQTRAQKRKMHSIRFTLIMMVTIPAVVTMLVTVLYARSSMTTGMQEEMIDGLVLMAESIKGGYNETAGDYTLGDDGCIYKGDKNITPTPESLDIYTENLDADVTICWGKTRTATTITQNDGSRATGTDIVDDVWSVVQTGETYKTNDIEIMGEEYYAVYVPLENEDGSVVGVIFAGRPCADVASYINGKVNSLVMWAVLILIVCNIVGFFVANVIAKVLKKASDMLSELAEGHLNVNIDERILKRKDEIGQMGMAIETLLDKLRSVVSQLKQSSDTLLYIG